METIKLYKKGEIMSINTKRKDYISWDEYFMGVAVVSSLRSKDPSTQVGACIVNNDNKIIGIGYFGLPNGCSDDKFPWKNEGATLDTKYVYVCHAELNAILNSVQRTLKDCKIYTTLFPCNECTKAIIQSGIKEIIYLSNKYEESDSIKAAMIMLKETNTLVRQFSSEKDSIIVSFK